LIIESLDRLSRQDIDSASELFRRILRTGLHIVTLMDNQFYTLERWQKDLGARIMSLVIMSRANEESETKSNRITDVWQKRREAMRAGRGKPTNACAGWLKAEDGKFVEIPERVGVMRRIIADRHIGLGRGAIATRLTQDEVPTFRGGYGWHPSTIAALVKNKALIGVYQPRKADGSEDGPPIEGFYPRLISDEDFWRAQWGPDNKLSAGRNTKGVANLLKGICKCGKCGRGLVYLNTGKDAFLVCGKARTRGCDNRYHRSYPKIERELLTALELFDYNRFLEHTHPQSDRLAALRAEIVEIEETVDRLLTDFKANTPPSVSKHITALEARRADLTTQLRETERFGRITEAQQSRDTYAEFTAMVAWLPRMSDQEERYRLRTKIASELRRMIVSAIADGTELTIALAPTPFCRLDILIDRATITGFRITLTGCDEPPKPVVFPRARVMGDTSRAGLFAGYVGGSAQVVV
jgi:hypothetical protein